MIVDDTCGYVNTYWLGSDYQYWDMALAPNTHNIVIAGFSRPDSGLYCSKREGVVSVLDQSFARLSIYKTGGSYTAGGIIPRFDNAKCVDVWAEGGNEYIAIAGNITVNTTNFPATPAYVPRAFICKFQLQNTGALTFSWMQSLSDDIGQFIPADIIVDPGNNLIFTIGSLAPSLGTADGVHWSLNTSGTAIKSGQFRGTSTFTAPIVTNMIRPYHITVLHSGNFRVSGWVDNYNTGIPVVNKYNFFEIEYDISGQSFSNLKFYLGNTDQYAGMYGPEFTSVKCGQNYIWTGTTYYIPSYHTPAFSVTWYDGTNDQTAWAWVHMPEPINDQNRHQLRIKCTIAGTGDGGDCNAFTSATNYSSVIPNQNTIINPWGSTSDSDPSTASIFTFTKILPAQTDCSGDYD
jgi:hypothetical protein